MPEFSRKFISSDDPLNRASCADHDELPASFQQMKSTIPYRIDKGLTPDLVLDLPVTPTTGYHPVDPFPPRDLDHTRVTRDIATAGAIVSVTVLDSPAIRAASDHRPKQLRLSRTQLPRMA